MAPNTAKLADLSAKIQLFLHICNFFCTFVPEMEEKQQIGQLFDRIAGTYDGLNHGLSMNTDRRWRRKTVKCMPEADHVLDVAIGTADLTIEMLRRGKAQHVTGIDLSDNMMAIGETKVERLCRICAWQCANYAV